MVWSHSTYNEVVRVVLLVIGHHYSRVHFAIGGNTERMKGTGGMSAQEECGGMRAQDRWKEMRV